MGRARRWKQGGVWHNWKLGEECYENLHKAVTCTHTNAPGTELNGTEIKYIVKNSNKSREEKTNLWRRHVYGGRRHWYKYHNSQNNKVRWIPTSHSPLTWHYCTPQLVIGIRVLDLILHSAMQSVMRPGPNGRIKNNLNARGCAPII